MTFDKWWKKLKPAECDELKAIFAECWNLAQETEREACAKVCEVAGVARIATLHDWTRIVGDELAAAIRERSNRRNNRPLGAG